MKENLLHETNVIKSIFLLLGASMMFLADFANQKLIESTDSIDFEIVKSNNPNATSFLGVGFGPGHWRWIMMGMATCIC